MEYRLVGTSLGRTVLREVEFLGPGSMPGPYKFWGVKVRDTVMVGRRRGTVKVVQLTCHSKAMAELRIKQRLIVVP